MIATLVIALAIQDVDRLTRELDSDDPDRREKAEAALRDLGPKAADGLREALKHATSDDLRSRLEDLLLDADPWAGSKRLAALVDGAVWFEASFNPQMTAVAYFADQTTGMRVEGMGWTGTPKCIQWVMINDRKQVEFEKVDPPFEWSPDGKTLAYLANRGGTWKVVGGSMQSLEMEGGRWHVVRGAEVSEGYDDVGEGVGYIGNQELYFSSDGKRFGYAARKDGKMFAVIDGKKGEVFDYVGRITFSPDGSTVAYMANRGGEMSGGGPVRGGKGFIVVDDVVGETFDSVSDPVFSADGKKIGFQAGQGEDHYAVVGAERTKLLKSPWAFSFKPDLSGFFYAIFDGRNVCVVENGAKGEDVYNIGGVFFSPDGKTTAYVVEKEKGGRYLVVNGQKGREFKYIRRPLFSPDGKRIMHGASETAAAYLKAGDVTVDALAVEEDPIPSPDWKTVAYVKRGKTLVVGKKESERYTEIWNPTFSADGRKIMFGALKGVQGGEIWRIVMDVE